KEYIPSVDAGIQDAMQYGILAGYPMVNVRATLIDGQYHEVDSSEMAFKVAGSMAFKEASRQAKPVILEPLMAVEVTTPEDYMGEVIGDLNARRGRSRRWRSAPAPAWSRHTCRCPRCSATSATSGRRRRAGPTTRWSSPTTPRSRRVGPRRSSPRRPASNRYWSRSTTRRWGGADAGGARSNLRVAAGSCQTARRVRSQPTHHDVPTTSGDRPVQEDIKWRRRSSSGRSRT